MQQLAVLPIEHRPVVAPHFRAGRRIFPTGPLAPLLPQVAPAKRHLAGLMGPP